MATAAHITRRAAVVGAGAIITGIGTAESAVHAARLSGAVTVKDQLVELATRFKEAAQIIDPSIKGVWLGFDVDTDEGQLSWVQLDRGTGFFAKARESEIEKLYREWRIARDEKVPANIDYAESDAFARYCSLQKQIVAIQPASARELALQIVVDTDEGGSCMSDEVYELLTALTAS